MPHARTFSSRPQLLRAADGTWVGIATRFLEPMADGATLRFEPRFTPAETARVLAQEGITSFVSVPAM